MSNSEDIFFYAFIGLLAALVIAAELVMRIYEVCKKNKAVIKQALCKHKYIQFGHKEGDPIDPNNPWVFCSKCNAPGLLKDSFLDSLTKKPGA